MKIFGDHLLVGTYEWLWNPDRTRYGGHDILPREIAEIEDFDQRSAAIALWRQKMDNTPLTEDEKRQEEEWDGMIFVPKESMDDDVADAIIAWSRGFGEFPTIKGSEDNPPDMKCQASAQS